MSKTKEEQIMRMLTRLNAMSRRTLPPRDAVPPPDGTPPPDMPPPPDGPCLGHGAGRLLGFLNDNGDMNQNALAQSLDIRPQSLSELLGKLEGEGFVTRTSSQKDRRKTIVSLTESGRSRVASYRERHRREAEDFLAGLSDEEKDTLYEILKKLVEYHKNLETQKES